MKRPTRWTPAPFRTMAQTLTVSLTLVVALSLGCSGALQTDFDAAPHGTFGAAQLEASRAEAASSVQDVPVPELDAPTDGAANPDAVAELSGPPTAEELTALGLAVDATVLAEMQADDWTTDSNTAASLPFTTARHAFLARNSAVRSAVQRHRASLTRYNQVDYLNDLIHQYDSFAEGMMTGASTPHVMPEQPAWPLQGAGQIRSVVADVDVEISRARLTRAVLQELAAFEATFHNAIYWSRAAKTYGSTKKLARESLRVAKTRYKAGTGGYLPVLLAQNGIDLLGAKQESAGERAQAERERLGALLELPRDTLDAVVLDLDQPEPVLPDRDALADQVLATGPDVLEATAKQRRSTLMVELVERQLLPEISPGTNFTGTGDIPDSSKKDLMYATRAPFLAEIKVVAEASTTALEHAERVVPALADERWAVLSESLRSLKLARGTVRKRTRQARDIAADGFRTGDVTFFELNASLTAVLDVDLDAHRYRRDAAVAAALLRVVTGIPTPDGNTPSTGTEVSP